jgi:flagellar basal body-associated protein FliL
LEDENHTGGQEARKGKDKMEPILVALAALVVLAGLIIAGTRFSLYLFLLNVEANQTSTQRGPVAEEPMLYDNAYGVEQSLYYKTLDTGSTSARYARNSLVVVAFLLLIAMMAIISIAAGVFH